MVVSVDISVQPFGPSVLVGHSVLRTILFLVYCFLLLYYCLFFVVHISARFFVFVLADVVLFVLDYRQYFCKLLNRVLERECGEKMGGGEGGAA